MHGEECFKYMIEEGMEKKTCMTSLWLKISVCASVKNLHSVGKTNNLLEFSKRGFALHAFKVEILRAFLQRHIRPDLKGKSLQSF